MAKLMRECTKHATTRPPLVLKWHKLCVAHTLCVPPPQAFNWNQNYNLMFLDNPCGVGFSFSPDESCFVTDQEQVGNDLTDALEVFYDAFPDLLDNDLYITGESYAGKYVPAFSSTVFNRDNGITLKGLSIGDGAMNPSEQFVNYGDLLYYVGMVSSQQRDVFREYEKNMQLSLDAGDLEGAFEFFDEMLNGDFQTSTYYGNVTGTTNYFNFQQGDCGDCQPESYGDWVVTPAIRDKIHVGDLEYSAFNETVEVELKGDWMRGVVDMLVPLLESPDVKVLVYSGQNDIILGPPLTEQVRTKSEKEERENARGKAPPLFTHTLHECPPLRS